MLTKDMKRTLEFLNETTPDLCGNFFTIDFIAQNLDFDRMKALAVCESLSNETYIAFGDSHKSTVRQLEKGINFKELKKQKEADFWKDKLVSFALGFISGVAVGVVTALLIA